MANEEVQVTTPLGKVKGSVIKTSNDFPIYTFQGIPYAKKPVGDLRFKDPVPAEPWTGVLDATKAPTQAACFNIFTKKPEENSGEDCLYVTVYTPQVPKEGAKLPVMFWIHGGGFVFGTGNRTNCGPDYLVPHGVILVSVNYRLGIFGFLSLQTIECPGNYGLKDQTMALRWVKENISAFGGDPNNVTIFGESAGGASVQYQVLSPLARGLFHKAIAQSGSALNRWGFSRHPVEQALALTKRLGTDTKDPSKALEVLRQASTEDLLSKAFGIFEEVEEPWYGEHILGFSFVPTVEPEGTPNAFLTKLPEQALKDGDYADVPYIQGVTTREMIFGLPSPNYVPTFTKDEEYQKFLPKEVGITLNSEKALAAARKLKEYYFPDGNTQDGYIRAQSALYFTYGVHKTALTHIKDTNKKSPDYVYLFDATSENSILRTLFKVKDVPGCCHADELEFIFYPAQFPGTPTSPPLDSNSKDGRVSALLTKMWTDFAKTGVPSPQWPASKPEALEYVHITDQLKVKQEFYDEETQFWDELVALLKS